MENNILEFIIAINKLKKTKRAGWVKRGIEGAESVSDHMYIMSIISLLVVEPTLYPKVDVNKCLKMALVHDMAEALVGDITPEDGLGKEEKHLLELEALRSLTEILGKTSVAQEIMSLWQEYENSSSSESKLVHQIDKLEMIIQAYLYEQEHRIKLDEFYFCVQNNIYDPTLLSIAKQVLSKRNVYQ